MFEGRAAVPAFGRFRKLFFLQPGSYELCGHVDVGWWPLGQVVYPLYYKCSLEQSMFPGEPKMPIHSLSSRIAPAMPLPA